MEKHIKFILQYNEREVPTFREFQERIKTRIDNYGAYMFLKDITEEEIAQLTVSDFNEIFESLYSTQREKVYRDLIAILEQGNGLGYFKGFLKRIIRQKVIDIDQIHENERDQIRGYKGLTGIKSLGFGKATMSQIAHFSKPDKCPIINTKSERVIEYLFNLNPRDNYKSTVDYANKVIADFQSIAQNNYQSDLDLLLREYGYIFFDDFVEFSYEIISS